MPQPRIPTAILEAKGSFVHNPDRARARANEPVPTGPLGDPPEHLDRDEKDAWWELAGILPEGVAMNSDRWAIERFVCLMVKSRRKMTNAAEEGLLLSYFTKYGMTASDRSRVQVGKKAPKSVDPVDEFLQ